MKTWRDFGEAVQGTNYAKNLQLKIMSYKFTFNVSPAPIVFSHIYRQVGQLGFQRHNLRGIQQGKEPQYLGPHDRGVYITETHKVLATNLRREPGDEPADKPAVREKAFHLTLNFEMQTFVVEADKGKMRSLIGQTDTDSSRPPFALAWFSKYDK